MQKVPAYELDVVVQASHVTSSDVKNAELAKLLAASDIE